jgi:predicted phosphodiesterase
LPPPKTQARHYAEELCRRFPEATSLSLARRLKADHAESVGSLENARRMIRLVRGNAGETFRKHATSPRRLGRAGQKLSCPPSFAEPFLPFLLDGCKLVGVLSDTHVPYHQPKAWEAAVAALQNRGIDTLVINGDYLDFYQVSRWDKNPKARRFKEEVQSGIDGLRWLRECFPKARVVYKLGNHDERWDKFIWQRAPEIFDLPACQLPVILETEKVGVEVVGEQRPIMAGKLPILHGHELAKGIAAPVNPARGAFLKTLHSVLVGHSHRTSTHVEPDMFGREVAVWSTGMLCAQNPEYNRFAKSNWGFACVEVYGDGEFSVENYRISEGWKVRAS